MLLILGDAITTDHISPVGAISSDSSAGDYLQNKVCYQLILIAMDQEEDTMKLCKGAFSNLQLENHMLKQVGGLSIHHPSQKN